MSKQEELTISVKGTDKELYTDSEPIDVIERIGYKKSWIKTEGFR